MTREQIAVVILNYNVKHGVVEGMLSSADAYPLADAILASQPDGGWQPIETAEKTGEIRLLRLKQNIPALGFWNYKEWVDSRTLQIIHPEGWARLPAPHMS